MQPISNIQSLGGTRNSHSTASFPRDLFLCVPNLEPKRLQLSFCLKLRNSRLNIRHHCPRNQVGAPFCSLPHEVCLLKCALSPLLGSFLPGKSTASVYSEVLFSESPKGTMQLSYSAVCTHPPATGPLFLKLEVMSKGSIAIANSCVRVKAGGALVPEETSHQS